MRDIKTTTNTSMEAKVIELPSKAKRALGKANEISKSLHWQSLDNQTSSMFSTLIKSVKTVIKNLSRRLIIDENSVNSLNEALDKINRENDQKIIKITANDKDIFQLLARKLREEIGENTTNMLNSFYSVAEQKSVVLRQWINNSVEHINNAVRNFLAVALNKCEEHNKTVMPGYISGSMGQPISIGYWIMAEIVKMADHLNRFEEVAARANRSPAGAFLGAGSSLELSPKSLARNLGFSEAIPNGLAALTDHSFIQEFLMATQILSGQASKFIDTFIDWMSPNNSFVTRIPTQYMSRDEIIGVERFPSELQKISAKAGSLIGEFARISYIFNKTTQVSLSDNMDEISNALINSYVVSMESLEVLTNLLNDFEVDRRKLKEAAKHPYSQGADLLHYLTRKLDLPYERAAKVTMEIIAYAIENGKKLSLLELPELQKFEPKINSDIYSVLIVSRALVSRRVPGGTSPVQLRKVMRAIKRKYLRSSSNSANEDSAL